MGFHVARTVRMERDSPSTVHRNGTGKVASGCNGREMMVGVRGFEPPAPASRRQCSTRLSYTPIPCVVYNFLSQRGMQMLPCKPFRMIVLKPTSTVR